MALGTPQYQAHNPAGSRSQPAPNIASSQAYGGTPQSRPMGYSPGQQIVGTMPGGRSGPYGAPGSAYVPGTPPGANQGPPPVQYTTAGQPVINSISQAPPGSNIGLPSQLSAVPGLSPIFPSEREQLRNNYSMQLYGTAGPQNPQQVALIDALMNAGQGGPGIAADLADNDSFRMAESILSGNIGLAEAQNQQYQGRLNEDLGVMMGDYVSNIGDLFGDYQSQMAYSGLNRERLGLDRQGYQDDIGYYAQMIGLSREQLANALQGFDLQDTTNTRERGTRDRRLRSDAAARGAFISQGFRDDKSDSAAILDEQLQGTQLGRTGADITHRREVAGYNNSMRDAQRGLAGVGITARQYGLDEQGFQRALQQGLRNSGRDVQGGIREITRALEDADMNMLGQVQNYVTELIQLSGALDNQ